MTHLVLHAIAEFIELLRLPGERKSRKKLDERTVSRSKHVLRNANQANLRANGMRSIQEGERLRRPSSASKKLDIPYMALAEDTHSGSLRKNEKVREWSEIVRSRNE